MKHLLHIIIFCFGIQAMPLLAQENKKDKIEKLHVSYINKRLELNESEAQKFWTVYNEYKQKQRALKQKYRQALKQKGSHLSEADAEELYQLDLQTQQAEADLHKQYSQKLKDMIGVKKVVELRLAEYDFRREVINSIQEKRNEE